MLSILSAVRDFIIVVVLGWLGISVVPADEPRDEKPSTSQVASSCVTRVS